MIEIFLLEHLNAFARNGTLRRAAEDLHISQPALSRSMKKLESELGVSLFDRDKSKITLNETGKVAAIYAERVLEADRELMENTVAFDRRRRTVTVGSCAPFPVCELLPILQELFAGMALTTEVVEDERLISGLKNGAYQLVVLHERVEDEMLICQRYLDERLYITVSADHPLATKKEVSFRDLEGIPILTSGKAGFWLTLCRQKMKASNLLIQNSTDAMTELVDASTLPVFNSDRMLERGYHVEGRVSIPVSDPEAGVTYYLACLAVEQKRYAPVFHAIRSMIIRNT